MEETVRSLLQNPGVLEQTAVDIMKAYKEKLSEEVFKDHPAAGNEPEVDVDNNQAEEDDMTKPLVERLKALEEQNSALALENNSQREQYERCLDEVANQVVQALLTQKDLREECLKLRTRVFDLEQQNRAMSILFQQRIRPASDLLLQKLHSRIMDLSSADLLLELERSKTFLLSRNFDSSSNELQLNRKAGLPVGTCLSQIAVPPPMYPRSSCSSSELSLSSACSELSSGSYTWNDGRSCGKKSSLTWEKRLSLGSSVPANICAALEEQMPTRCKESHILEGLRKLQRRKHRSSSASSKVSRSGYKDCMNSNEGIYSLGIKSSSKGVTKSSHTGRTAAVLGKKSSYDSDDADDELAHFSHGDSIPTKDSWLYWKRLSHSTSDSLCSWERIQEAESGSSSSGGGAMKPPPGSDSKERPEELMSFINSFLPEGGRTSAFTKPSKLHSRPLDLQGHEHISDVEDPGELPTEAADIQSEQAERDSRRLSCDAGKLLTQQWIQRSQTRTQSADGRVKPFSLVKEPRGAKCTQSEESIIAIFNADRESADRESSQKVAEPQNDIQSSKVVSDYTELVSQVRPTRQKSRISRNINVLEPSEKQSEHQFRTSKQNSSTDKSSTPLTPQRKPVKALSIRANKGLCIPPINHSASAKSDGSKISGSNKPVASPLRSKGCSTESVHSCNSGSTAQPKSSSSARVSRFVKTPGSCSQGPNPVSSRPSGRAEFKSSSSCSPHLSRRHLNYINNREPPTRDKHCEASKNKLRSPSPPPPPGRTTSLLIKPNYDVSTQAQKPWVAPPSTPATVRGPPPSYHTALLPNMQGTLPIRHKDSLASSGYGTAATPHKLAEKNSQQLPKSPVITQTPTQGTLKRITTKDYLPSANSGCPPETEMTSKGSKSVPPPYSALHCSSISNNFAGRCNHENAHFTVQKGSVSLPLELQDGTQGKPQQQNGKSVISPPNLVLSSPNAKTRIPMGFKAFLKSPPGEKNPPSMPGKQEKDHINSMSKETVTSNVSTQCENIEPQRIDSKLSIPDRKGEVQSRFVGQEAQDAPIPEGAVLDKTKRSSLLFSRSISVTTKPHLKPALGMNGAKARSQSFSSNNIEKPNINTHDGPAKIRTQFITSSGERGSSLSRQNSLEVQSAALSETPVLSPRSRVTHYGGMTGSNIPERIESISNVDGTEASPMGTVTSPSFVELRNLPGKAAKVSSHAQFKPPPFSVNSSQNQGDVPHDKEVKPQKGSPDQGSELEEKRTSTTACTIEEKVMLGIKENAQKCQEQEKIAASESKQKTGPSLANWFGLRKSKLPSLSGKKADSTKAKDEKKELKMASVLGGKSDKKKERKKGENQQTDGQEGQNLSEMNNKLSSIIDHCNNQMGQIANQIQCTTAFIGKDQFVRELFGRASKCNCVSASPPGVPGVKKHAEICPSSATLLMTQKINLAAEIEEELIPDTACQDHMIGSSCQMRTLDSGIGTFPLPDSVTRISARSIPKSESSPESVTSSLTEEPPHSHLSPLSPDVKVSLPPKTITHAPSSMGHSQSDHSVTSSSHAGERRTHLPKLANSDAIKTKRSSLVVLRSSVSMEDKGKETQRSRTTEQDVAAERALQVSSNTDAEPDGISSSQRTLVYRTRRNDSVEQSCESRKNPEKTPSIMDYCHLEKDGRMISQHALLHRDDEAANRLSEASEDRSLSGSATFSLDTLNKLNHGSSRRGSGLYLGGKASDEPSSFSRLSNGPGPEPEGSLYDSFSSCTSQGSNNV
eukprot:XP_011604733.1 PREDICTED: nck-associated protein 5-like isoform X4 [Takifugu rubripes]